jgi:hypothetical protein
VVNQTVEYYSALKRNVLSNHEETWRRNESMSQVVEYLLSTQKVLSSIPSTRGEWWWERKIYEGI